MKFVEFAFGAVVLYFVVQYARDKDLPENSTAEEKAAWHKRWAWFPSTTSFLGL